MPSMYLFTTCGQHKNCTQKLGFVDVKDGGYDMVTNSKPTIQRLQTLAETEFGDVYCVEVFHINGTLDIKADE